MSRIGKLPITIVKGVRVALDDGQVSVEGPRGRLAHPLPRGISAEVVGEQIVVHRRNDTKQQKALHGLVRALLANAVRGVTSGFSRKLEINGVGYSAVVGGKTLTCKLGYSHPVEFPIPEGIEVKVEKTAITVAGHDRQLVGQVAADIRALRPPDVYKQKGIRYSDETLRKKAGKTGAK
jgi:large subunit ribosomal protein L6